MPNPKTTALTREAAWKAKQMYEERDERGRRKYSIAHIADFFCVGETTAYRAIKNVGPYQSLPEVKDEEMLDREIQESLEKLKALQAAPEPKKKTAFQEYLDKIPGRGIIEPPASPNTPVPVITMPQNRSDKPPPSAFDDDYIPPEEPLEGGSGLERLKAETSKTGDAMLTELKGDKDGSE